MGKLRLGPIGMALNVSADDAYLKEAAELEELGYSTIWLPGGQIDRLDRITAIIEATTSVPVASGTIPVDVYEPAAVRQLYAGLQAVAPDRFVAGLGSPQKPHPLGPLNDYLDQLDHGDPPVPAGRRILAALGPRKLELARDRAAGAVPLLVTPAYTRQARRILGTESTLVVSQMLVLDTDAARAREAARMPLGFLSGIRGYRASFARMGFADSDIAGLSDRLVDDLVIWGSTETVTARVREHLDAGADQVALTVLHLDGQPRPIEAARELAGRFPG
ncbi:MAG: TIGR03620 family F420-dependent LLM class oxidoreductase [Streptosporangiaceae bacterium]